MDATDGKKSKEQIAAERAKAAKLKKEIGEILNTPTMIDFNAMDAVIAARFKNDCISAKKELRSGVINLSRLDAIHGSLKRYFKK